MRTRFIGIAVLGAVVLGLTGCGSQARQPSAGSQSRSVAATWTNPNGINLSVMANGEVRVGSESVTLEQLGERLDAVKSSGGSVWYYREHPDQEPPPVADQVVKAIIDRRLPVSFSTQPDFSDAVDEHGVSHPRS